MRHLLGSIKPDTLIGMVAFAAAVIFFLWLQYDKGKDNLPWSTSIDEIQSEASKDSIHPDQRESTQVSDAVPSPVQVDSKTTSQTTSDAAESKPSFRIIGLVPESERVASSTELDQPMVEEPLGDMAISGRVLTHSGTPVAGAKVTATVNYIFEDGRRKYVPRGARQRVATTMHDGSYAFDKLANGEYNVGTEATKRYGRAWIQVRAGVDFADLVVTTHQELRVQGLVTNAGGEALAGVKVRPQTMDASEATTNRDGRYSLTALLPDTATALSVRATRNGYQDRNVSLARDETTASGVRELNIVMEPDDSGDFVKVSGSVKGSDGDEIIGQRLTLSSHSLRQNHRATTDSNGRYSIVGVEPGDDYTVTVNAPDNYKDYFQRNIAVPEKGLTLNIELEEQETGTLRGHMVNVFGNAVPDFSLVLQTVETSYYNKQVIGDRSGRFEVKKAPAGELRLRTKSNPYYSIEGIRLAPGEERDVRIVLDWGYDEILGRIVDQNNSPVAAPNVTLTWTHMENGIRTSVRRTAAADAQGNFRFSQLGPGNHQLRVNAPGYRPASVIHDPSQQGSNLRVELVEE